MSEIKSKSYNAELYGGGWFASPIYETQNGLEVRPAGDVRGLS